MRGREPGSLHPDRSSFEFEGENPNRMSHPQKLDRRQAREHSEMDELNSFSDKEVGETGLVQRERVSMGQRIRYSSK